MKPWLALVFASLALSFAASGQELAVANVNDAGVGSFRWAIEQANANVSPNGTHIYFLDSVYVHGATVALQTPLPAITASNVYVDGGYREYTIDGHLAGTTDGLVITGDNVAVNNLKIANFRGDGVVIRGDNAYLEWVVSSGNHNGIRIEGSRAQIFGTSVLSNADTGIWITRQSRYNQIGREERYSCQECGPQPPGPDDILGNGGTGLWIEGAENSVDSATIGVQIKRDGFGEVIDSKPSPNGGVGIFISGAHNTVLSSVISNNGSAGVFLGAPAFFEDNSGACNGGPFVVVPMIGAPRVTITYARSDPTVLAASGNLQGQPNTQYEIVLGRAGLPCPAVWEPALGKLFVTTDATGFAPWKAKISHLPVANVFAIATRRALSSAPETSPSSDSVAAFVSGDNRVDLAAQTFAPASAVNSEEIEIDTVLTNNGPSAISGFEVKIPRTPGTSFVSASTTSGNCWLGGLQFCEILLLGAGESATIRERVKVTVFTGRLLHVATASFFDGEQLIDPNPSNNTATAVIQVVAPPPPPAPPAPPPARYRPARH